MGVPKFYRWISERYPCLSEVIKEYQIPEFDNLYLDMNGIIHVCSHPNDDDPHFRISEEKIFADICHYLDFLFKMIKPQKIFFMAVDGVAPRAKMNQQRGRRFRTARSAEMLEQKARAGGEILPQEARFDSNCITPGTVFMARLHEILKNFVSYKISTDKLWQNIQIYLSGHETPGEGEHKIMDFIRYEKSQDNYDPNTRHCLYGLDADLIMLGLSSHEPHFSLLREEVRFGKKESQKRIVAPEEMTFHLLHLSLLREYLGHEFSPVKGHIDFEFSIEKIIDDFVLMSFLVGNDFIPHLPQLHIHHNALPILFKTYIEVLPSLGGYINEAGNLNLERFELFFQKLAEFDYEKFGESSEFPPPGNKSKNDPNKSETEKFESFDKLVDLGFSELSLSKITEYDSSSEDDSDGALFELEFSQHKMDYYRNKLEYDTVTAEVLRSQAEGYVRAIQWNLHYYYNGIASWSWFYPHHYAPYISDVKNFKDMDIQFDMGEPFSPFQQLLAVLPIQSKTLLPESYQELMCSEESPLKDYYPEDFQTDLNGKQQDWEAVVLIPFINEKLLLKCCKEADKKLSTEQKERNQHGPHLLYTYTTKFGEPSDSFLPGYFPPLPSNHAKCQPLDKDIFRLPPSSIKKGLCHGVKLDVHFPGFPTLKHIKHMAKLSNEDVKVFQMVSQRDNMMLTITESVESDTKKVANSLLGQGTYVGWPHLQEGLVMSVSDEDVSYIWDGSKITEQTTNAAIWKNQYKSVQEYYYKRLGIFIGEVENPILIHVKSFTGMRLICSDDGEVTEEKQWTQAVSNYPLQTTVKDITVHWSDVKHAKTCEDLFSLGSVVFMLGQPHYGSMGIVIDNDLKKNKSCIVVNLEIIKQPDLRVVIRDKDKLVSQKYRPGYELAKNLGISSYFLSRITGTFLVQTNSKESISPNTVNVGLNLKFNRKNEEVAGYSKKNEYNEWLYSEQVLDTLSSYLREFPEFFDRLVQYAKQDVVYLEDMYPNGDGTEVVAQVCKWLKSQHCSSAERQMCGLNTLDEGIVSAIESLVNKNIYNQNNKKNIHVKPKLLYSPFFCKGCILPDPNATFQIFDRVINVRYNLAVPLGLQGTVIGIKTADKICDYIYEVVFDKEFFGGLSLHCSSRKGYRMPPSALINISYGERTNHLYASPKKSTSVYTSQDGCNQGYRNNAAQRYQSYSPGNKSKPVVSDWHDKNNSVNGPPPSVQILRKTVQKQQLQNMPFYKMDGMALSQMYPSASYAGVPSPLSTTFNPPRKQFVMPKATKPVSNRNTFGAIKTTSQNVHGSNYHVMWNDLIKKPSPVPSPVKPEESKNFGKAVTVEELFNAVDDHNKVSKDCQTTSSSSSSSFSRGGSQQKQTAVLELMNHCTHRFGTPPIYNYQEIGLTGCYISSVELPDGQRYVSAQCPNQPEAAENAAEQALVILRQQTTKPQNLNENMQPNYYLDGGRTLPGDVAYSTPIFTTMPLDMGTPLLQPPAPFPPPYPFGMPLMRYPRIPMPLIPESFVKQNQLLFSGQAPIQQILPSPVNMSPVLLPQPVLSKYISEDKPDTSMKENVFVPLQVLKNTTKKQSDDEPPISFSDSEWPSLPSHNDPKENSSKVNLTSVGSNATSSSSETMNVPNSSSSSFAAAAQAVFKHPKPQRKTRLAAVFSNAQ